MTVRVRKLAKELQRSPSQILGILHALGFERYRSPEDMLADPVEAKVRWAVRRGMKAPEVEPERARREQPREVLAPGAMAAVVPGVVRQVDERFVKADVPRVQAGRTPSLPPRPAEPARAPAPNTPDPVREAEVAAELAAQHRVLTAQRQALDAERQALDAERAALAAERAAWASQRAHSARVPLADVLRERGLVGVDESERALRALAEARRVPELLPFLEVSDPAGLQRWLREVLVLVDGPPPAALASEALVTVAPDRAEVPGAATWSRLASLLSERLLLHGARRAVVVGGPPRAHRLLRLGMDPRVELRFRPARQVGAVDAEADLQQTDAVALWDVTTDAGADAVYAGGRARVARIRADGIRAFVEEWARALGR